MPLKLLEKLCHKHGIFSAGNADRNPVSFLYQLIFPHRLGELAPDAFPKSFPDAFLHIIIRYPGFLAGLFFTHVIHQPSQIPFLQAVGLYALLLQKLCRRKTDLALFTIQDKLLIPVLFIGLLQLLQGDVHTAADISVGKGKLITDIDQLRSLLQEGAKFL